MEQGGWEGATTKKEQLILSREKDKLERTLGGIREMSRVPSAVWIVDTKKEHIAVGEARKLGIPVIAILDTNCDPDEVDYKIPGNDDAIRSAALLTRVIADAVAEGSRGESRPNSMGGQPPWFLAMSPLRFSSSWPPSAAIAVTTSATTVSLRPTMTTDAPSRPNASAAARPIPLVAPVTMTVFPVKVMAPSLADCRTVERAVVAGEPALVRLGIRLDLGVARPVELPGQHLLLLARHPASLSARDGFPCEACR